MKSSVRAMTGRSTSTFITCKSRCVSCQPSLFIVVTSSLPFQTKPGINLKTQTLKGGCANGFPFAQYSRKFQVEGLLVEVQADWEDLRRCFLPLKPLAGTTGFLLSLQPKSSGGVQVPPQ
ncbi:hypothetical protein K443DRAFT_254228 [Laccaria amethystina LaAM-08-1]|uniref:Uncharacterized protein n=1 Tax=Laccaria amethystina LaAM-08-1 TaxID=1095629 RepID=A0A0C9WX87_9AGAR|nr:hypothetical protein K443DRAFT_254228 [Laccaria amethystina LaAM-08-1]